LRKLKTNDSKITEVSFKREKSKILSHNDENYTKLAEALKKNTSVTCISLNFVKMVDANLNTLCQSIPSCTKLDKINIASNNITTQGIINFAYMLETHISLTSVAVEGQFNPVGPDAEKALVNALSQNPRLISLTHVFRDQVAKKQCDNFILRNVNMNSFRTTASFVPPEYPYPEIHAKYHAGK